MTQEQLQGWLQAYQKAVQAAFPGRVRFIGLQGSRGRGEARPDSDIDMVLVLDTLTGEDLRSYRALLDTLPQRHLACGFVSGAGELAGWDPADRYMLYRDTRPLFGSLDALMAPPTKETAAAAALAGVCQLYHLLVHQSLHCPEADLSGHLKSAGFNLRAKVEAEQGIYARRLQDLEPLVQGMDKEVLTLVLAGSGGEIARDALIAWAGGIIREKQRAK